jgi:hypothetical protein
MWGAYRAGETSYTDEMRLWENWPATTGYQVVNARRGNCAWPENVDVSKAALRNEISRVVSSFLQGTMFDGVFFDTSSWDIYLRQYEQGSVARLWGSTCLGNSPFHDGSAFERNFLPNSPGFAVGPWPTACTLVTTSSHLTSGRSDGWTSFTTRRKRLPSSAR